MLVPLKAIYLRDKCWHENNGDSNHKALCLKKGRLFEAGRLLNFHHFQQVVSLFCNKTINNNKTWRCTF